MKTFLRLSCLVLPLALTGALSAQTAATETSGPRRGPGGPGGHGGPRGNPVIRVLDTDRNHELSAAEIANAAIGIRSLDLDGDGNVSVDELRFRPGRPADATVERPARPERPTPPADAPARTRPMDPVMLALDANADGALSAAEIANAATSLGALDADKNGTLSHEEFRPLPPEGAPADAPRKGPRGPRA